MLLFKLMSHGRCGGGETEDADEMIAELLVSVGRSRTVASKEDIKIDGNATLLWESAMIDAKRVWGTRKANKLYLNMIFGFVVLLVVVFNSQVREVGGYVVANAP